jgi:hypothetical protein
MKRRRESRVARANHADVRLLLAFEAGLDGSRGASASHNEPTPVPSSPRFSGSVRELLPLHTVCPGQPA